MTEEQRARIRGALHDYILRLLEQPDTRAADIKYLCEAFALVAGKAPEAAPERGPLVVRFSDEAEEWSQ